MTNWFSSFFIYSITTVALSIAFLGCASSGTTAESSSAICSMSDEHLISSFLDVTGNAREEPHPQLMRWKAKRELVLNIFQDRSARRPNDALKRNTAVFKAMANVDYTFEFALSFQSPDGDIGVVFVSEAMKKNIAQQALFDVLALDSAERCPAYLEFADGEEGIRWISKARVVVSDQLPVDDIPECVRTGLSNAIGLIGLRAGRAMTETKEGMDQIEFFISTLYDAHNINSLADIEAAVAKGKRNLCQ